MYVEYDDKIECPNCGYEHSQKVYDVAPKCYGDVEDMDCEDCGYDMSIKFIANSDYEIW